MMTSLISTVVLEDTNVTFFLHINFTIFNQPFSVVHFFVFFLLYLLAQFFFRFG